MMSELEWVFVNKVLPQADEWFTTPYLGSESAIHQGISFRKIGNSLGVRAWYAILHETLGL